MRRNNIGILSHPFLGNYGGILQACALSIIIELEVGPSVIAQCTLKEQLSIRTFIIAFFKIIILLIGRITRRFDIPFFLARKLGYLSMSSKWAKMCNLSFNLMSNLSDVETLTWVVGSDQVWRAKYARWLDSLPLFFLDFATVTQRQRSISYAASFGSDEWEGTQEETEECGRLLREFKAVSVREHRGIKICKEVFGVDAVQMPDPTLLLHTEDYVKIIDSEKTWQLESNYMAAYVLDETAGKGALLQDIAEMLGLQLQHLMPHATAQKRRDRFPISVPQWLRLIRDCEYFITDSFHGCVFAIIFNKPFVCLGNEGRGNARFDTLLSTFRLEDRMLTLATPEEIHRVLHTPIDWECVNAIHDTERERGINFLKENLL